MVTVLKMTALSWRYVSHYSREFALAVLALSLAACDARDQGASSSAAVVVSSSSAVQTTSSFADHACVFGITTPSCIQACRDNPASWERCDLVLGGQSAISSSSSSGIQCPVSAELVNGVCVFDLNICQFVPSRPGCASSSTAVVVSSHSTVHTTSSYFDHACVFGITTPGCIQACRENPASWERCDLVLGDPGASTSATTSSSSAAALCHSALGNGGWQACFALEDGSAQCVHKDAPTQPVTVTGSNGQPLKAVSAITGAGYFDVIAVTGSGLVQVGSRNSVSALPKIPEAGILASGGQNTRCVLVRDANRRDIRCWKDNSDAYRPELPLDFNAIGLSANYSDVCALNADGKAWCWEQKADNSLEWIGVNPVEAPFSEPLTQVAVGQLQVCGVKRSGGVECLARWDSSGYLPSKGSQPTVPVAQAGMETAIAFQAGFGQGISVHRDGTARLWKNGKASLFEGVTDAVAAGGDRGVACVLTAGRDIVCLNAEQKAVKVTGAVKARATQCLE